jgi:hypothetical protein
MENADGGNNNGDTYTVAGLAAGVTVQLNNIVNARDANTVSLALADASGSEDTLTFITAGTSGHGTDNNVDDVAFTDVETLSIVSASVAAALGAAEVNTIDDISADTSLTTINVSGAEKTTLTLGAEMTNLATFDGSAAADNVTVDATGLTSATTFKGGSGADTFTLGTTLNASDTIEGGTQAALTNDTLTATITGLDAVTGALNVSGVEVLGLTNNGVTTINAASITGASTINLFASSDTTTFTNLAAGSTIGLGQTGSADQVLGAVNVGLADETGSGDVINFGVNEATSATLTATAIETANFGLSNTDTDIAEASLTVSALNVSTINVSGAAADVTHTLNLNTLDADTATVDASAYRGVLTVQTSGTATSVSVRGGTAHDATGGAGDDTFTVSSGTAQYNVDGGAGTDSLAMTLTNGTLAADDIVNFETSSITVAASADVVVDLATGEYVNDNDFTTLTVTGGNGISTFVMGGAAMGATGPGADAIGIAAGTEATGLTLIDGSGFAGGMGLLFGDGVLDNSLTVRGGAGTDTVSAAYAGGTDTIHLENVEILRIQSDATSNVDLTDTVGLARVFVDDDGTAAATTLTDLADGVGVFFSVGAATSSLTIDMENALGATDSLNVELVASTAVASTLTVTNVETLNLDVEGANFSIDLGGVTMATAAATSTLNITGDNSLTISGTDTDIRTIDASGMVTGGAVVQTGREATGASTYTGSLGNDTFIMMSPTDVLAGGGGSDTLDINYAAILGGLSVDLSSTTDQIVSWNGSAAAGTVTGFENADATGYTGTFGALLVGNTAANSLLGTANNDQISGSSGIDTLAGNDGADTIDLGADTDADNYLVAAITDGAALADDESVEADTVNNFVAGTDDIQIAAAIVAALGNTAATNALPVSTNAQNGINKNTTDSDVFVITTAQDDLDDLSDVIATIGTVTTTAGDDFFVVVNNTAGTQSGLYYVEGGGANSAAALTAGEIALVGIINTSAALGVGDVEIGA